MTAPDSCPMARSGKAAQASGFPPMASFIGATGATIGPTLPAPALAKVAIRFGPADCPALDFRAFATVGGASPGAFIRRAVDRQVPNRTGTFGRCDPRGIAVPEASPNAAGGGALPPMPPPRGSGARHTGGRAGQERPSPSACREARSRRMPPTDRSARCLHRC